MRLLFCFLALTAGAFGQDWAATGTDSVDAAWIRFDLPTTNYGTLNNLRAWRTNPLGVFLMRPKYNGWTTGYSWDSGRVAITWNNTGEPNSAADSAELFGRKCLRAWTEAGVTWNTYDGSNNWTTAGCQSDGNDRTATPFDSVTVRGDVVVNSDTFSLSIPASVCSTIVTNGIVIEMDQAWGDVAAGTAVYFNSDDAATAALRVRFDFWETAPASTGTPYGPGSYGPGNYAP